jgi:type I restriction enzyme S subunit
MKYGLTEKQLNEIREIIASYQEVEQAILFGSRAIDTFKEASDVDIAIIGDKCDLLLSAKIKDHLEDETYLPFFFDIIAYNTIKSPELKNHIQTKGKIIFQRKEEWKEVKLGKCVNSISETYKFLPNEKVVFLNTSDIYLGSVLKHNYDDSNNLPGQAKKRVKRGDLLFSEIRPANGRYALIDFDAEKYVVSTKLMVLRTNSLMDKSYFKFFITSKDIVDYLQTIAEDRSGTFPQITFDHIATMSINLPPLSEQKAIAEVLSSLDDKIDLLHRQNKTLEEMAETLFRQWFIEERDESWEETKLDKCVDIAIGRTPPRKQSQWFSTNNKDMKWISIKDMGCSGSYIFNTSEYLTQEAVEKFNIPIIPKDTVVLSFKMTVGRVAITSETMLSNEAIAHFRFNDKTPFTKEYLYLFLKTYQYETLGSTSSIVTSINSKMIKEMVITLPDQKAIDNFNNYVAMYFNKIRANQVQLDTLEKLRDILLPRLMRGEVEVS